jgi:hypothetical protein
MRPIDGKHLIIAEGIGRDAKYPDADKGPFRLFPVWLAK